jgi:GT2 family glycosyltransferase
MRNEELEHDGQDAAQRADNSGANLATRNSQLATSPRGNSQLATLSVVILNWNGAEDTEACLESLARGGAEPMEAVVVDNGSEAADLERVCRAVKRYPWATLVRSPANLGFAEGSNVGVRRALARGAAYVLLLNNDATVEPGAIRALVEYMEGRREVGLAAPLILDERGERIWAAGAVRARREVVSRLGLSGRTADQAPRDPFECYALTGCALLARREVFETVGELDPEYFAYVEDVDFSRRARAAGWRLAVVPSARVRHRVSASSGGGYTPLRSYLMGRGTAVFIRRRASLGQRLGFALAAPLGLAAAALREAPRGNAAAVAAKLRGYLDGLRARPVDAAVLEALRREE